MTHFRTRKIANTMLEGSFTALLWLSAFAIVTADPDYRNLAAHAIGAVSIAIVIILAIPGRWLRAPDPDKQSRASDQHFAVTPDGHWQSVERNSAARRRTGTETKAQPTPQQEQPQ